jgi:hypothetical protein
MSAAPFARRDRAGDFRAVARQTLADLGELAVRRRFAASRSPSAGDILAHAIDCCAALLLQGLQHRPKRVENAGHRRAGQHADGSGSRNRSGKYGVAPLARTQELRPSRTRGRRLGNVGSSLLSMSVLATAGAVLAAPPPVQGPRPMSPASEGERRRQFGLPVAVRCPIRYRIAAGTDLLALGHGIVLD